MADNVLTRTAKAMYRADEAPNKVDWGSLPKPTQSRYLTMAAAALSVALRLTLDEEKEFAESLPV